MKRRGFQPNVRTYATLLAGLGYISDFSSHSIQLENAHKLYNDLMELVSKMEPDHPELSISPINSYMTILGRAGLYQKLFDVYQSLENTGPLAPSRHTFSIIFSALRQRGDTEAESNPGIHKQNAADARLIWRRLMKMTQEPDSPADTSNSATTSKPTSPLEIDDYIIAPIIQILYRGSPSDQLMAFELIRTYLGLSKPGESEVKGKIPLDPRLFYVALDACVRTQKHRLALHWMHQIMEKPLKRGEQPIIEHRHIDQMLLALGSLAQIGSMNESVQALEAVEWAVRNAVVYDSPHSRPSQKTYQLAMSACWRCGDWDAALRLFELMTGYEANDFLDGVTKRPVYHQRSEGFNMIPNNPILCTLARTAIATDDQAKMRQCLRILTCYRAEHLFQTGVGKFEFAEFYASKMADAVVRLVDKTMKKGELAEEITQTDAKRWLILKTKAREIQKEYKDHQYRFYKKGLPPLEESSLIGGSQLLNEMEEQINLEHDRRTSAPAKRF